MKLKRIAVKNIKKIESLDVEFNGNVFAIAGDNEVGKSTLLQLILQSMTLKNKIPVPVTQGKTDGSAVFEYEAPGGMPYQVKLEYNENGKEKLTLMAPGGIKSTKVTDLRNVFDYHDVSVEEFMLWSDTKDGRKKQRDLLLSIFPKETQEMFLNAIAKEKEYYDERAELNKLVDMLEKQLKGYEMTEEQLGYLEKKDEYKERIKKLNAYKESSIEKYANIKLLEKEIQDTLTAVEDLKARFPEKKKDFKERIDKKNDELEDAKLKVKKLEEEVYDMTRAYESMEDEHNKFIDEQNKAVTIKHQELNKLNEDIIPQERLKETEQKLNATMDFINGLDNTNKLRLDLVEKVKVKKEQKETAEKNLSDIRAYKEQILKGAEMPIPGLSIDDEGLNFNGLPFDKNQLSTSQFMQVVLKILVAINKKTPIIPIGRAESFGKKKLKELVEMAERENCQIFFEKVKDEGNLTIEVFEENEFRQVELKDVQEEEKKEKKTAALPEDWREKISKKVEEEDEEDDLSFLSGPDFDDNKTEFDEV